MSTSQTCIMPLDSLRSLLEQSGVRLNESRQDSTKIRSQRSTANTRGTDIILYDQEKIRCNISKALTDGGNELIMKVAGELSGLFDNNVVTHLSPTHCVDDQSLRGSQQDSICSILLKASVAFSDFICQSLLDIAASHLSTDHVLSNCADCKTRLAVQHLLQVQQLSSSREFIEQYMKLIAIIAHDTDMCDFLFVSLIRIYPESDLVLSKFLDLWNCEAPHAISILSCFSSYASRYIPFHSKVVSNLQASQLPSNCEVDAVVFLFRFCRHDVLIADVLPHLWVNDDSLLTAIKSVLAEPYCNLPRVLVDHFCKLDRIPRSFDLALLSICCYISKNYPRRLSAMIKIANCPASEVISCYKSPDIGVLVQLVSNFASYFSTQFQIDVVKSLPLQDISSFILHSPKRSHLMDHVNLTYIPDFIEKLHACEAFSLFKRATCVAHQYYDEYRYQLCHPRKCNEPLVASQACLLLEGTIDISEAVQSLSDELLTLLVEVLSTEPGIDELCPKFILLVVEKIEEAIGKRLHDKFILSALKVYAIHNPKAFSDVIGDYQSSLDKSHSLFALNFAREIFNNSPDPAQRVNALCHLWDIVDSLVLKGMVPSSSKLEAPVVNYIKRRGILPSNSSAVFNKTQRCLVPKRFNLHSRLFRHSPFVRPLDMRLLSDTLMVGCELQTSNDTTKLRILATILLDFICDKIPLLSVDSLKALIHPIALPALVERILREVTSVVAQFDINTGTQSENELYSQIDNSDLQWSSLLSLFCCFLSAALSFELIEKEMGKDLFLSVVASSLKVEVANFKNASHFVSGYHDSCNNGQSDREIPMDSLVPVLECAQNLGVSVSHFIDNLLLKSGGLSKSPRTESLSPDVFCELLTIRLMGSDSSSDFIDRMLDKIWTDSTQSQLASHCNVGSPPCSNKLVAPVFKILLARICHHSDSVEGSTGLADWTTRIGRLSRLINVAKRHHQHEQLGCYLVRRACFRLIPDILSKLIPLVESQLIEHPHDCLQLLQTLQGCTRFIQHCCVQLRWTKNRPSLAKLIPKSRRNLELIIYRVQKALRANSMQSAFSCGQLKCRDITGREICSQMSVVTNGTDDCELLTQPDEAVPEDQMCLSSVCSDSVDSASDEPR